MPHSRSITALTREHIGLRVLIVDGTSVRSGQLTNIEAAQTYSPNSHPNEWLIEIDGVPQAHSVSATWSKVTDHHDLVAASDALTP